MVKRWNIGCIRRKNNGKKMIQNIIIGGVHNAVKDGI